MPFAELQFPRALMSCEDTNMNIYQPYTYLIKFLPTGQVYYGSSFANNKWKVAHPSQLWTTYFTSSKEIKKLIAVHGKNAFAVSVRRCFDTKEKTIVWENKILTKFNAAHNPTWLNKSNGSDKFVCSQHSAESKKKMSDCRIGVKRNPHSEETRKKLSQARQGKPSWNKGLKMTDETKLKMSEIAKQRKREPLTEEQKIKRREKLKPVSDETRKKISEALTGKTRSNEFKAKMSEIAKKRPPMSEEVKAKISAANKNKPSPKKGIKLSDEVKAKMSAAKMKSNR